MRVTADTKIHDLLRQYPELIDFLVSYDPAFTKLRNPVLRKTVLRVATVGDAAQMAGVPAERFTEDLSAEIATFSAGDAERGSRQALLKEIIKELHDGAAVADVKARFDALVQEVDSTEIAEMEQALIREGVPVGDVQRLCDVHVSVFKDALEAQEEGAVPAGHPVDTYRRENEALAEIVNAIRCQLDDLPDSLEELRASLTSLSALDTHYTRKENQLFPLLERHGVTGPTQVMWAIHDDIRDRLKTVRAAATAGDAELVRASLPDALGMIEDMVYKEERILFPVALETLTESEWESMAAGEAEIGFAWVDGPATGFGTGAPAAAHDITPADIHAAEDRARAAGEHGLPLTTGRLTPSELDLVLRNLPVDITFVGPDDRVRYYSEGMRVFPRSPAVIGREVRNCHPPASVEKVEQILSAFKAGEKDTAEFWIQLGEKFVVIRYIALHDERGEYVGCLEVSQDATHVRSLEGERRLLDW
ncbi:MAG: DUF438 domain-containing protein [Anaerosomatales bacterium]|nr:DUF438 domain-containing protein [Anaerosomatales bacterium]